MFLFGMQTNLLRPADLSLFILARGKYATIREISPVASVMWPCPERDLVVNTKPIIWITPWVIVCFLSTSIDARAEADNLLDLCNNGNSSACFERGKKYVTLDRDNKKAIVLFRKACGVDHMTACLWGGNLIQKTGTQYSPQWKEASKMFQKACDAGEDGGCFNLGSLYYKEGRASKAKKLFKKACDLGNQAGCDNVKWLSK
jgi:hypothetical protein